MSLKPLCPNKLVLLLGFVLFLSLSNKGFSGSGKIYNHVSTETDSITVYIFLLETCPICQSLTIEMKSLYSKFQSKGITFIGLFPNEELSSEDSIKKFGKKYNLPFELKMDDKQNMVKRFSASVTPEVFVIRNSDNAVLYKGRIDNSFEAIGKRRQVITEHYLNNALENILSNKPINPAETKPVGCFISK